MQQLPADSNLSIFHEDIHTNTLDDYFIRFSNEIDDLHNVVYDLKRQAEDTPMESVMTFLNYLIRQIENDLPTFRATMYTDPRPLEEAKEYVRSTLEPLTERLYTLFQRTWGRDRGYMPPIRRYPREPLHHSSGSHETLIEYDRPEPDYI